MDKVSVIVPVYNVDKYLRGCLDSIMHQTYQNWECLLIDDGSKDNSSRICDDYSRIDPRFIVCHIENHGVSHARNLGLNKATGKYFTFVDSDDICRPQYLEFLVNQMLSNDVDCVVASHEEIFPNSKKEFSYMNQLIDLNSLKRNIPYGAYVPCKLYKKEIQEKNSISFPEEVARWEDGIFFYSYLNHTNRVLYCKEVIYDYMRRDGSASVTFYSKYINDLSIYVKQQRDFYVSKINDKNILDEILSGIFITYSEKVFCTYSGRATRKDFIQYISQIYSVVSPPKISFKNGSQETQHPIERKQLKRYGFVLRHFGIKAFVFFHLLLSSLSKRRKK